MFKVNEVFNIKGRGWVLQIHCPLNVELPKLGKEVLLADGTQLGIVRGVEYFVKNVTRGEEVGIVLGGCKEKPECKEIFINE